MVFYGSITNYHTYSALHHLFTQIDIDPLFYYKIPLNKKYKAFWIFFSIFRQNAEFIFHSQDEIRNEALNQRYLIT